MPAGGEQVVSGLDVIVVNHHTPGDLRAFLDSLQRYRPDLPYRLLIANVDPAAADERVAHGWISSHRDHPVDHVVYPTNVGYNVAVNGCAAVGDHDTLAVFNADIELTPGALDRCYAALWAQDDWGILGPRQVDGTGRLTAAGIFGPLHEPKHRGWHQPGADGRYSDVRDDAAIVAGSALFIRRELWGTLADCPSFKAVFPGARGAFAPTFGWWGETYCCGHAAIHGHKRVFYGEVTVVHHHNRANVVTRNHEKNRVVDQATFRRACDAHDPPIPHD